MAATDAYSRVVVTGMGVVTPIGQIVAEFWSSLKQGKCGIGPLEGVEPDHLNIQIAAKIKDFDHVARLKHWRRDKTILHSERFSWLASAAADEAIKQSKLETPFRQPYRTACIIGSAAGGQISGEKACRDRFVLNKRVAHPMLLARVVVSTAAAHVGIEHGVKGPTYATCSAGASAAHAISLGRDYIRQGLVDVAIVGGADSPITYGAILASQSLGLLSPEGCFPFAGNRNGTVLGEGAGVLVLESESHAKSRGAKILAEICGVGMASNGTDMLTPDVNGASEAMHLALCDAKLDPAGIDYLNANGTATKLNDRIETEAIKKVFGQHAPKMGVSSTKSMHGHAMGAASAIEAVASIEAMRNSWMPATIGLHERDPRCDLDYVPNVGREKNLQFAMSNSFALGGLNAALVFSSPAS